MKLYAIADYFKIPYEIRNSQHLNKPHVSNSRIRIMGELTGEFREPKKDEFYLSGAIPECYIAPNDLTMKYHIVRLVIVESITIEKIIRIINHE